MREIVKSRDYKKRVHLGKRDEVEELSKAFNTLISEVDNAMRKLSEENLKRIILFRKLVEIFLKILTEEKEERVITTVVEELQGFMDLEVGFSSQPRVGYINFPVKAQIFEGESLKEKLIGYLYFKSKSFHEELKAFFRSVGRLISLQIERINMMKLESFLRKKAEASSRAKSAFIAHMSHELRTPLHAIIGFSEYLRESTEGELKEIVNNIKASGEYLLSVINEILEYAKAEAQKLTPSKKKLNLREVLEEVEGIIKPLALKKGLNFYVEKKDLFISSDEGFIKKILLNLLSNAVKFTESGWVKVLVEEEKDFVKLRIIDTGIGISKEEINKIFEPFERGNTSKFEGTGLGLALVKKLVEALGGEVGVISEGKGKGSEFWVKIPRE